MKPWKPPSDLFWFLKEDAVLDLDRPGDLSTAVQHTLDRGGEEEVRELIRLLGPREFLEVVRSHVRSLHPRVRPFWMELTKRSLPCAPEPDTSASPAGAVRRALEHGRTEDIRAVIRSLGLPEFRRIVAALLPTLDPTVRPFWESFVEPPEPAPAGNPR